jgi:N-acetylglucosaminyldiphosphoundecaprenol N-acetyl-beta-D-mannosaminyltransferase
VTRINILGVGVDAMTESEAVNWVAYAIADKEPRHVATVNPEFVMRARRDQAFRNVLARADLCLPDGVGVIWAARQLGQRLPERIAGVDFIQALARRGAQSGWRFFLLGAAPGVAEAAAAALIADSPRLQIAGCLAGSPQSAGDAELARAVRAARTDILLVAYGAPSQELWIARNLQATGAGVAIGVGGAFDFLSGRTSRAPRWMRQHGLEWLHRLAQEPWRWRRMLALPRFVLAVVTRRWLARTKKSGPELIK